MIRGIAHASLPGDRRLVSWYRPRLSWYRPQNCVVSPTFVAWYRPQNCVVSPTRMRYKPLFYGPPRFIFLTVTGCNTFINLITGETGTTNVARHERDKKAARAPLGLLNPALGGPCNIEATTSAPHHLGQARLARRRAPLDGEPPPRRFLQPNGPQRRAGKTTKRGGVQF
jgi:hypothetical protein